MDMHHGETHGVPFDTFVSGFSCIAHGLSCFNKFSVIVHDFEKVLWESITLILAPLQVVMLHAADSFCVFYLR